MKKLGILLLSLWPAMAFGDARSFQIPGTNAPVVQTVQGHPLMVPLEVNIAASAAVTVLQGASGVDTDPWNMMLRNAAGTEIATVANPLIVDLGANNDVTVTSGSITIDNAAGASAVNVQDGGNSLTIDGTVAATQSGTWNITNVSGTISLPTGASIETKQDDNITQVTAIELNTDSPTGFGGDPVTVTSTATLISAASPTRRSLLIRNSDSNTVLFVGPTSGVTTDSGLPMSTAGASGANGNGGTIIYTHTAAVWGIVASGTAEIRIQSESD